MNSSINSKKKIIMEYPIQPIFSSSKNKVVINLKWPNNSSNHETKKDVKIPDKPGWFISSLVLSGLIRKCALLKNVVVPNYFDMCPRNGTSFFYLSNNVFYLLVPSPRYRPTISSESTFPNNSSHWRIMVNCYRVSQKTMCRQSRYLLLIFCSCLTHLHA